MTAINKTIFIGSIDYRLWNHQIAFNSIILSSDKIIFDSEGLRKWACILNIILPGMLTSLLIILDKIPIIKPS